MMRTVDSSFCDKTTTQKRKQIYLFKKKKRWYTHTHKNGGRRKKSFYLIEAAFFHNLKMLAINRYLKKKQKMMGRAIASERARSRDEFGVNQSVQFN